MTMKTIEITCPNCKRGYKLELNLERLARIRTRALCTRCDQTFDVASRLSLRRDTDKQFLLPEREETAAPGEVRRTTITRSSSESLPEIEAAALRSIPPMPSVPPGLNVPPPFSGERTPHPKAPAVSSFSSDPLKPQLNDPVAAAPRAPSYNELALDLASLRPSDEKPPQANSQPPLSVAPKPPEWLEFANPGLDSLSRPPSESTQALEALLLPL